MSSHKRPRPSSSSSYIEIYRPAKRSRTPETNSGGLTPSSIFGKLISFFNSMSQKSNASSSSSGSSTIAGASLSSTLDSDGGVEEPASVRALLAVDSARGVRHATTKEVVDMTQDDEEDDVSNTAGPSRIIYTTARVYPQLPTTTSVNLFDEGSLRPEPIDPTNDQEAIDQGDVEDFDDLLSPSRSPLTSPPTSPPPLHPHEEPTRTRTRPKPLRPILDAPTSNRFYPWLPPSPTRSLRSTSSHSSSTSSQKSPRKLTRKRSTLRDKTARLAQQAKHREWSIRKGVMGVMPDEPKRAQSILSTFARPAIQPKNRQLEAIYHRDAAKAADTKKLFAQFLSGRQATTDLDEAVANAGKPVPPAEKIQRLVRTNKTSKEWAEKNRSATANEIAESFKKVQLEEEEEIQARLTPQIPKTLTPAQQSVVTESLKDQSFRRSLVAEVTYKSLVRLRPSQWLDDEIVNFYSGLLQERSEGKLKGIAQSDQGVGRKIHAFNSFFYAKLSEQGYERANLKRWTKKTDIFEKDVVLIPINLGNMHWTAAAINIKEKRFEYYDSMGDGAYLRKRIFNNLRKYLDAEHRTKKGTPYADLDDYEELFNEHAPQQDNGSDCGVFSMQTLESIARGRDYGTQQFEFKAANMAYFRQLMVYEIAEKTLVKRW